LYINFLRYHVVKFDAFMVLHKTF